MKTNLSLVKAMVDNGYEVYYYGDNKYRDIVEESGASFIPYKTDLKPYLKQEVADDGLNNVLKTKFKIDDMMYNEALASIEEITPSFIMHDGMAAFGKHAAFSKNVKAVSTSYTMIPRLISFLTNRALIRNTIHSFLKSPFETLKVLRESRRYKKKYGLKQNPLTDPFVSEEDLNIVFLPEFFQPQRNLLGEKYFFTKPIIEENTVVDADIEFINDKPLVYVCLGTMSGDCKKETEAIIKILLKRDVNILLSKGRGAGIDIPENEKLIIRDFVNQENVLKSASLFINHGGMHSVYESIWYKVPQICIPNQTEQESNARTVQKIKCGVYVKKLDEKKLEKTVDMILSGNAKFDIVKRSNEMKNGAPLADAIKRMETYLEGVKLL